MICRDLCQPLVSVLLSPGGGGRLLPAAQGEEQRGPQLVSVGGQRVFLPLDQGVDVYLAVCACGDLAGGGLCGGRLPAGDQAPEKPRVFGPVFGGHPLGGGADDALSCLRAAAAGPGKHRPALRRGPAAVGLGPVPKSDLGGYPLDVFPRGGEVRADGRSSGLGPPGGGGAGGVLCPGQLREPGRRPGEAAGL